MINYEFLFGRQYHKSVVLPLHLSTNYILNPYIVVRLKGNCVIFALLLAFSTFFALFVLFLVISKTLNAIINQLVKIEYIANKELEYRREEQHIRLILLEAEVQQERMKAELFGKKR